MSLLIALRAALAGDATEWAETLMFIAVCIEAATYASRVFSREVHEQTLSLLRMLPVSWFWICWSKLAGCALGLAPSFCFFVVTVWFAVAINPATYQSGVLSAIFNSEFFLFLFLGGLFLHLTMYFSLLIKYGAIPLALLAVVLFVGFAQSVLSQGTWPAAQWATWHVDLPIGLALMSLPLLIWAQIGISRLSPQIARQSLIIHVVMIFWGLLLIAALFTGVAALTWAIASDTTNSFDHEYLIMQVVIAPFIAGLGFLISRRLRKLATQ